jgi:formylglycine-generating enzyme required for sulfatase activity
MRAAPVIGFLVASLLALPAQAQPLSATQERALKAGDTFRECDICPEMVAVPAGAFAMGSPATEESRDDTEGPQHPVRIGKPFALGKFEVTVDQFAAFIRETGHDMGTKCDIWKDGSWEERPGYSWRNPGFAQEGTHPVACISWDDATAYLAWLSRKTGATYRLPTEAEWEYAARAGTATRFHFGDAVADYCRHGNGADQSAFRDVPGADKWSVLPCSDGYGYTAPVGRYAANGFGLHDTAGNVFEWVEDCWHDNYDGAPADGSAWVNGGDCKVRVQRGGAWGYPPAYLRVAVRGRQTQDYRYVNAGLRVARPLAH